MDTDTQAQQQTAVVDTKPKSNSKLIIIVVAVLLLLCCCVSSIVGAIVVANSRDDKTSTADREKESDKKATPTPKATKEPKPTTSTIEPTETGTDDKVTSDVKVKMYQTAEVNNTKLTATSFTVFNPTNPVVGADSGNKYVVVGLELENVGKQSLFYSPLDFTLTDSKGETYDVSYFSGVDSFLPTGDLENAQKVVGKIDFEVPQDEKTFILTYSPFIYDDEYMIEVELSL